MYLWATKMPLSFTSNPHLDRHLGIFEWSFRIMIFPNFGSYLWKNWWTVHENFARDVSLEKCRRIHYILEVIRICLGGCLRFPSAPVYLVGRVRRQALCFNSVLCLNLQTSNLTSRVAVPRRLSPCLNLFNSPRHFAHLSPVFLQRCVCVWKVRNFRFDFRPPVACNCQAMHLERSNLYIY